MSMDSKYNYYINCWRFVADIFFADFTNIFFIVFETCLRQCICAFTFVILDYIFKWRPQECVQVKHWELRQFPKVWILQILIFELWLQVFSLIFIFHPNTDDFFPKVNERRTRSGFGTKNFFIIKLGKDHK